MTLSSTIITASYRESNFTAQGGTLTAEETSEGLALLQSLVDSFFGNVVGTRPKMWWVPLPFHGAPNDVSYPAVGDAVTHRREAEYPPANSRLMLRTTTPTTFYFPQMPDDGAMMQVVDAGFTADVTLDANGSFFYESGTARSILLTTFFGSDSRVPTSTYIYRAELAAWVPITDLGANLGFPLPAIFDDYFITSLAMRLAPRFGNEPKQITMLRNKDMLVFCRQWYRQMAETRYEPAGRSEQSWNTRGGYDNPDTGGN
jgi:hypothetical protein